MCSVVGTPDSFTWHYETQSRGREGEDVKVKLPALTREHFQHPCEVHYIVTSVALVVIIY